MFLGSTSLREWAVYVGMPGADEWSRWVSPFFKELKLFCYPEDFFPDSKDATWPLTDEQWETGVCHTTSTYFGQFDLGRWHASNGAYLTIRDLVERDRRVLGSDYDDEFYTIWAAWRGNCRTRAVQAT